MHAPAQKMKEIQESLEQAYLKNGQDMMVDHLKHVKPKDMRVLLLGITKPKMGDDYVLAPGDGRIATFGLPDSGRMPEVIAPDLSNLPPGQKAVDAVTGEEVTKPEK